MKTAFLQHVLGQMLATSRCVEKITVKMVLPEDGNSECQNVLEYEVSSVSWCVRHGALRVGLIEDKINYGDIMIL